MPLIKLTDEISYLPSVDKPISSDVAFIKTSQATWIFDTGTTKEAAELINSIEDTKNVVISHFHFDHIFNLTKIKYDNLYVSKYTKRYSRKGTVVEGALEFPEQGIRLFEIPSSHAKGCLALEFKNYAFLGDATYCKIKIGSHEYNVQLLEQMIQSMEQIKADNFCLSHDKNFSVSKESVIALYKKIFNRRIPGKSTINVNDFFNADGSTADRPDALGSNTKNLNEYLK